MEETRGWWVRPESLLPENLLPESLLPGNLLTGNLLPGNLMSAPVKLELFGNLNVPEIVSPVNVPLRLEPFFAVPAKTPFLRVPSNQVATPIVVFVPSQMYASTFPSRFVIAT